MKELEIFNNEEFGDIRTTTINDKIFFCGRDIAKALGYSNPTKAVREHCEGGSKTDHPYKRW